MESLFYTLHDFMMHTKAITYIVIIVSLVSMALFWRFLTDRENNNKR